MSALSSATSTVTCRSFDAGFAVERPGIGSVSSVTESAGSQRSASSTNGIAPTLAAICWRAALTRSDGRCALPARRLTVNVVPPPSRLATVISPPCRRTSSCTSARPIPVPSNVRARACLTRWKRSNIRGRSACGMPTPVSETVSTTRFPSPRSAIAICPSNVNFRAFDNRVQDDRLPRHPAVDVDWRRQQTPQWTHQPESGDLDLAGYRNTLASSAVNRARSVGS